MTDSMESFGSALQGALRAGKAIMEIYDDPKADFGVELKADNSPLTLADKKANEIIISHLEKTPYDVLSEESGLLMRSPYAAGLADTRSAPAFVGGGTWIVDPLDGTKEFIKRNGDFTVNIGLVIGGEPKWGIVYAPARRLLYFTDIETGLARKAEDIDWMALEGGEPRQALPKVRSRSGLLTRSPYEAGGRADTRSAPTSAGKQWTIVASRSHLTAETEAYIERQRELHGGVRLERAGSSLKLCLVAEGRADVYPRFGPTMEWDTAAGHALLRAAGKDIYIVRPGASNHSGKSLAYCKQDWHNPWFIAE